MKLTIVLLMMAIFNAFGGSSYSQTARVNLDMKDASIQTVLSAIEGQSEFFFLYSSKMIDINRKVEIHSTQQKISEVLDKILDGTDIQYFVKDRQILLVNKKSDMAAILQQLKITGIVRDESGNPLAGVNIQVEGTTIGAITDINGKYSITVPDENALLIFSFVGYNTEKISAKGKTTIDLQMVPSLAKVEEVVVVGYGIQKKVNLTGSVSSIGDVELTKRPSPNVENLLQGKIPGLQVVQAYGKPGDEGNVISIRGLGTFSNAGSSPLILIDGIAGNMSSLNPNDIASVSVLKDAASSAIYGARAANGVIIITTKKGNVSKGINVEYDANIQVQRATALPQLVTNSADYMTYWNEARTRNNSTPFFSQATIDAFKNNTNDPVHYPNFNWIDYMFHSAIVQNHYLNFNGGNDRMTINVSLGYMDQPGILNDYDFKKYSGLISAEEKVTDWFTLGGVFNVTKRDILKPDFDDTGDDYVLGIYGAGPNFTPTMKLPNGNTVYVARYSASIGDWTVRNPKALETAGYLSSNIYDMMPQVYASIKLGKNLTWYTKGSLNFNSQFSKLNEKPVDVYYFDTQQYAFNNYPWHLGVEDTYAQNSLTTFYSTINYSKVFNSIHNINFLAGYNQEYNHYRMLDGARTNFATYNLTEISAGSPTGQTLSGTSNEWSIQSIFGRFTYDYKSKYLFEANARYDGTSRIASSNRWGFFPSLSAGWRLSEESFIKKYSWITNLKLRGSWGQLGNQNVGLYPYQEVLNITGYPFDTPATGVVQTTMVDKKLKWETTTITDIGLDIDIKSGLFSLIADWYNKNTADILYQIPIPASVGLSSPTVNYGAMKNTGVEFEVGHSKRFGDFSYKITLDYSKFKNEVTKIVAPSYGLYTTQVGIPFNSFYLIEMDGIFQNQADIDASATQPYNPKPGDLKFKDVNGDKVIDSKDRVVVDGAYPKFAYGGSINFTWKDFDLSAFFQGVYGQKFYNGGGWGVTPFLQGTSPTKKFVSQMWTGEGSTNSQPAMYMAGYGPVTGTASTYFLYDASYMRLKSLVIGYNIPKSLTSRIHLKDLRVYVSGDNLFTITKYPEADPERALSAGRFSSYPQIRTYTFGIKVTL